ncbi:hypothetical protein ACA086_11265 [Muriicola sp. E247]|uniref:hypothetical protein n=1 Tax=Muriicola sp. E247 TaxID=3242730 RepID=UPI003523A4E2
MSKLKDRIEEINKTVQKSRRINNFLWIVVIIFVGTSIYFAIDSEISKEQAIDNKEEALAARDSLKLLEEDLQGEKNKLEEFKKKYDSLVKEKLETNDDLWQYTVEANTFEAYMDYINIKGEQGISEHEDELNSKLNSFFNRTGYVQFQESNSNILFEPISFGNREDFYTPKSARSVRKGVIGVDQSYGRNGDVILEGQIVQVVETIPSGNSKWVKIRYSN